MSCAIWPTTLPMLSADQNGNPTLTENTGVRSVDVEYFKTSSRCCSARACRVNTKAWDGSAQLVLDDDDVDRGRSPWHLHAPCEG
jgi:hypothetical protein